MNQPVTSQPVCRNCRLSPAPPGAEALPGLDAISQPGRSLHKGEHLFHQGDAFDCIFLVRAGSLKVVTSSETGLEKITGFYFPTQLFGFSGLDEGRYPVSAIALEQTLCSRIAFAELERLAQQTPGFMHQLLLIMSHKIHEDQQVKLLLSRLAADSRLAAFLLSLSAHFRERGFSALRFRLSMSRQDIADYLGLAMETASRSFSHLQQQGLVQVAGREIEILNFTGLCLLAEGELEL
ncbi:transcriptional regulator [Pseudomonas alcaligenes]|uniref:Transcriptional regulator n=1 Tax=Aquipseudomonas alcaligenes TaxID=43263 RepID=A0ABR7S523_AQUAC|nr:helix-turn-helix domain-containing protein [Pseudomonas alcaligenes]MBC9251553.1 transcriptional regulator [Pseudomonas alcaligenes]